MISVKDIRIPYNYVLVKVEDDYETLQVKGKDTGILVSNYVYQDGKRISRPNTNFSVFGKVYGVPEKIRFNREKIAEINNNNTIINFRAGEQKVVDGRLLHKIYDLKNDSCRFETDNELEVGDTIKFSYFVHITAKEKNAIFDTEEGKMYFIKYDDVYMTVNEDKTPKKMVNGYILIDPNRIETKVEGGIEYSEQNGIVLPKLYEVDKHKRGKKCMEGRVVLAGRPLTVTENGNSRPGGYFDVENYFEKDLEVKEGDTLLFDPRVAMQLEHDNHQEQFDHRLYLIQRKDIIFMEKENTYFAEIGLNNVNYERV